MSSSSLASRFSRLVALPHSVFALPFGLAAFLIAFRKNIAEGAVDSTVGGAGWLVIVLVVGAVVAARTAAMAFNRLVDAEFDSRNPRTAGREIPTGQLSRVTVWGLVVGSSLVFFVCAASLGKHCLMLSPIVLLVLLGYSFTKRFTAYAHLVLGLALALAPGGAWWVLRPLVELTPLLMMAGVMFWVAGFDLLYSCQDVEFDRNNGLHSIPASVGVERAFLLARGAHLLSALMFAGVGFSASLGVGYFIGLTALSMLFALQHLAISPNNLARINLSFFTLNGLISIGYFLVVCFL